MKITNYKEQKSSTKRRCHLVEKLNTSSGHFFSIGVDILLNVILHSLTKEKNLFNWGNFFLQLEKNFSLVGQ